MDTRLPPEMSEKSGSVVEAPPSSKSARKAHKLNEENRAASKAWRLAHPDEPLHFCLRPYYTEAGEVTPWHSTSDS